MTDLALPDAHTGSILDARYRLDEMIGEGGMARVYRAEDLALHRTVAIKLMRSSADSESDLERVRSETTVIASLAHPSLVTLYDAHVSAVDQSYLVMEHVEGRTLQNRLAEGPLAPPEVAALAVDLAEALHVVHSHDVVHRDVKPSNVLLWESPLPDRQFRVKLTDFGIAYLLDSTRMTSPGTVMGTAAYLSPEQVRGEKPTPAADIYSLGLLLIESLTARRAFGVKPALETLLERVNSAPEIPEELSEGWRALLTAMTATNPTRRPSSLHVAMAAAALREPTGDHSAALAAFVDSAATQAHTVGGHPGLSSQALLPIAPVEDPDDATQILSVHRNTSARRRAWMVALIVLEIIVLVVAAIAIGAAIGRNAQPDPAPSLPQVEQPLNGHLEDLMDAVTP